MRCEGCGGQLRRRAGSMLEATCNALINPRKATRAGSWSERLERAQALHTWLRGPLPGWGGYKVTTIRRTYAGEFPGGATSG